MLKEIIKSVRKIELKTRSFSNQNFIGRDNTSYKGLGMNFSEVREYHFGDETRFIDWNVTARYNNPHVKVFDEEKEHVNVFFIDVSGSLDFGSNERTKRRVIIELFATMAFSCTQNQDKIGAVFFSDRVVKYFEPKKGRNYIWSILKYLIDIKVESQSSNPEAAFSFFRKTKWKKYRLFLFSDLIFSDTDTALNEFIKTKKRNSAYVIKVYDQLEYQTPFRGFYQIINSESGTRTWINGYSNRTRAAYKNSVSDDYEHWKVESRKNRIHLVQLSTGDNIFSELNGFFKVRG